MGDVMQLAATVLGSEDWGEVPHEGNSREETLESSTRVKGVGPDAERASCAVAAYTHTLSVLLMPFPCLPTGAGGCKSFDTAVGGVPMGSGGMRGPMDAARRA